MVGGLGGVRDGRERVGDGLEEMGCSWVGVGGDRRAVGEV